MTTPDMTGELKAIVVENGKSTSFDFKEDCYWVFMYILSGKVKIDLDNKISIINNGDFLFSNQPLIRSFEITGSENSELIIAEITL